MMYKRWVIVLLAALILASSLALFWRGGSLGRAKSEVAVVHVEGVIMGGNGQGGLFSETAGIDKIVRQLHAARDDEHVRAVVLRINSPGGSAPASQELGEEIKKLRRQGKPVVTSMGDVAASGGYWLAACTDKVYANPTTLTGSIGVYVPYANWEELYKKIGIRQEKIKSGAHKDILSPERQMTLEERLLIQEMVDDIYRQFIQVVVEGRGLPEEKVRVLADGRIYTGHQALQAGLVDELGTLYDAIDAAWALAGLTGKPVVRDMGRVTTWDILFGDEGGTVLRGVARLLNGGAGAMAPMALPERW